MKEKDIRSKFTMAMSAEQGIAEARTAERRRVTLEGLLCGGCR